jgi:hypothetical protein
VASAVVPRALSLLRRVLGPLGRMMGLLGTTAAGRLRVPRRRIPALAATLIALAGMVLLAVGGLLATVFAPSSTTTATLRTDGRRTVVSTAVGLLDLAGPRARVEARTDETGRPVFLGIGRAADVEAYLKDVPRTEVTGHDRAGGLLGRNVGSGRAAPDPAAVDVWVVSVRRPGAAAVSWPATPGQWRLVAATDGASPAPSTVSVTWSGRRTPSSAPVLIALGVMLLVAGAIILVMLRGRARGAHA